MIVFSTKPGAAAYLPYLDGNDLIASMKPVSFGKPDENKNFFQTYQCLVAGIGLSRSTNFYLSNAIGKNVYLYTFGDQPGAFQLRLVAPLLDCTAQASGWTGLLHYYETRKLSVLKPPILITLAAGSNRPATLVTYLTSVNLEVANAQTNMGSGTLSFLEIPEGVDEATVKAVTAIRNAPPLP